MISTKDTKGLLKEFGYYFVDFFISIIIGLAIAIILNIPMKFTRVININLGSFVVQLLGMCIALYMRSYSRGYYTNTRTYTFQPKKVLLFLGVIFILQNILVLMVTGHAVYVSGPTYWLASFVLPAADRLTVEGRLMLAGYDWLFMILADIFIYAPIMILGEYQGDKQNRKELALTKQRKDEEPLC